MRATTKLQFFHYILSTDVFCAFRKLAEAFTLRIRIELCYFFQNESGSHNCSETTKGYVNGRVQSTQGLKPTGDYEPIFGNTITEHLEKSEWMSIPLSLRIRGFIGSLWQFGSRTRLGMFFVVVATVVRGHSAQLVVALAAVHAVSDPTAAILPAFGVAAAAAAATAVIVL